ncbi:MAG: cysteine protease, partial [Planctomycetota bacterium]
MSTPCPLRLGWIPDVPDARDYSCRHARVTPLLMRLNWSPAIRVPDEVDLQSDDEGEYFRPVEDQGDLNSSAAFAVLSLVEYFERRVRGHTFDGSKRFLYRITSHMSQRPGGAVSRKLADVGVELRTTFKALNQFGVVPEQYYPYFPSRFDEEPSQFIYGLAKVPDRLLYFRLDEANQDGLATWRMLESFLAAGFPVVFGFSVPGSLSRSAEIPYRP